MISTPASASELLRREPAARCTVAPHVTTVTRSPRVTYVPRPNGSIQSAGGIGSRL